MGKIRVDMGYQAVLLGRYEELNYPNICQEELRKYNNHSGSTPVVKPLKETNSNQSDVPEISFQCRSFIVTTSPVVSVHKVSEPIFKFVYPSHATYSLHLSLLV